MALNHFPTPGRKSGQKKSAAKTGSAAVGAALLSLILFFALFIFMHIGPLDFWWWMSLNLVFLTAFLLIKDRTFWDSIRADLKNNLGVKLLLGLLSSLLLYGIFWLGNELSRSFFAFAGQGIEDVYAFKSEASLLRITLLMTFIIGPGEEVFWRGGLQRLFQKKWGGFTGFLAATALYALVHAGSGNIMLILAAAVCGLYWGWLYLKTNSILLVAASHTVWDILIFLVFPL